MTSGADDSATVGGAPEADFNCELCARLTAFRADNRERLPEFFNGPVPSFGPDNARVLIVGLAPGLRGANRTGRPFTGDFAGDLLYKTLIAHGFAHGVYDVRPDDGICLTDCMITNAVRCVPPENKPTPSEITTCRRFLSARIASLVNLVGIVALGRIAHQSTIAALGLRQKDFVFAHGAVHQVGSTIKLFDSYHCSRYNTNTGVLTTKMFDDVFSNVRSVLSMRA